MSKATSGIGILITGFLLDVVVGFPAGTQAQDVGEDTIWRLGAVDGFLVPAFHIVPMLLILRFGITKDVHRDIHARLTTLRSNSAGDSKMPVRPG